MSVKPLDVDDMIYMRLMVNYTRDSYYISYYNLVCQTFRVLYLSMIDAPVGRHLEFVLDSVYL